MQKILSKSEKRQMRYGNRSKAARKWARLTMAFTIAASLFAIWQDKELAPRVHAGMTVVADKAASLAENSEGLITRVNVMLGAAG